ncbi:MAG: NAD-dependent epimerase/dehydratase family protein [Candidatus Cyclobacteriaceae bacterium M2_1C_046]
MAKTALIAGATGLVGSSLLEKLIYDDHYDRIIVIARTKPEEEHTKVEPVLIPNFDHLADFKEKLKADDVFCCLGTTMAKAGSKEKFRKVDHDYVVELAKITRDNGAKQFLMVSALGADKKSGVFYNKVKGETEEDIRKIDFPEIHILRPSLLTGPRKEKRAAEDAAKNMYKMLSFIFIGPLKKYKDIEAEQVAKAMLHFAKAEMQGNHIHQNKELLELS